ncbi:hypothetical protein HHI36_007869 [Cryptolaemus montrouzieri]|uniref:Uncharacterized protein n=1 Tax=Cryptolaemus montrouzieri TaxID=559131 RepID=A0ABD2MQX4_9CUCU
MTIYVIPCILATATPLALTTSNIIRVAGIYPFNPNIFTEADFMPSYFSDRPLPLEQNQTTCSDNLPLAVEAQQEAASDDLTSAPSTLNPSQVVSSSSVVTKSTSNFQPIPSTSSEDVFLSRIHTSF